MLFKKFSIKSYMYGQGDAMYLLYWNHVIKKEACDSQYLMKKQIWYSSFQSYAADAPVM